MLIKVKKDFISLYGHLLIMKQELTGLLNAPVVFAHNDLLSGNLMFNDEEGVYDLPFPVHMLLSLFC